MGKEWGGPEAWSREERKEMKYGYQDKILEVDLDTGKFKYSKIDENDKKRFIGGSGLGAKVLFDRLDPGIDPLGPDNLLVLMTGPLTGTNMPGTSRFAFCAKSPLTGIWGESSSGGNFGPALKHAGYDGIIFSGKAPEPQYLHVKDDRVALLSAQDLWGKDTYEVTDILKEKYPEGRILSIGPAGENLVKIANINNDKGHVMGRSGMGVVMGSKKLKAIVVESSGTVRIAKPEMYEKLRKSVMEKIEKSVPAQSLQAMGTDVGMDLGMMTGDVPVQNWTRGEDLEISAGVGGFAMTEKYLVKNHTCSYCPIFCKRTVEVKEGDFMVPEGPGPEYETCAMFGPMLNNANLAAVIKANELCNRYGIDTISSGGIIAWLMECFEKGIITAEDTDGVELTWGNMHAVFEMLKKITFREGLGDVLAEGSRKAAVKIGKGSEELTVEIKGLEVPMHDPRGSHGLALAYMMSPRGGCHMMHLQDAVERGVAAYPEMGLEEIYEGQTSEGKAKLVKITEDIGQPLNAICLCQFVSWCISVDDMAAMLSTVTGCDYTRESYAAAGESIWMIKRVINNLMGIRKKDDRLPKKILTALKDGAAAGSVPDEQKLLKEYYELRGLDEEGIPTMEALSRANLEEAIQRLYR